MKNDRVTIKPHMYLHKAVVNLIFLSFSRLFSYVSGFGNHDWYNHLKFHRSLWMLKIKSKLLSLRFERMFKGKQQTNISKWRELACNKRKARLQKGLGYSDKHCNAL